MSSSANMLMDGECRCGKVRLRISAAPLLTAACHCTGCQRMSSSAFSLSVAIPALGFAVTEGATVIGGLHGDIEHHFCAWCMTWIYTRPPAAFGFVNVRPTMLEDPSRFTPFIETYVSEKLPWATTPAPHKFERFPPPEAFEDLIREYAAL